MKEKIKWKIMDYNAINIYYHLIEGGSCMAIGKKMTLDNSARCNYIVVIQNIRFEWDISKNTSNKAKHDVAFEEAATVLLDNLHVDIADPDHSQDEERFIALGIGGNGRLLVVCYSMKQDDTAVRIISARKATANEAKQYGEKTNARRI
ncbi:MAG: BrnT family toxin [Clostridiales bacterium]|nr:BrnT family toxin [Clostridiales bacterium]